jgi:hypothetical protein
MIPKNMKVGDTFTDGNRIFEVLEVREDGMYVSKFLKTTKETFTKPAVKAEEKAEEITEDDVKEDDTQLDSFNKYTKTEIKRLKTVELEKICDKLGLEKSTRLVMIEAIIEKLGL